ncbi:MAG: hypothetical protein AB1Z23_03400 [Eubacteriales bacterium]
MEYQDRLFNIKPYPIKSLKHYTNMSNLKKILDDKTWKLTNILSMNDKKESTRLGIDGGIERRDFSTFYLASFSNMRRESHAMWHIYGTPKIKEGISDLQIKKNKVLIDLKKDVFFNSDNFEIDYFHYWDGKNFRKCMYNKKIPLKNFDNYLRTCLFAKINYYDSKDEIFEKSYSYTSSIKGLGIGRVINISNFGRIKTRSWEYEKEIRLLAGASFFPHAPYEESYLLLRLKDKFFEKMKIILSPWDDGEGYDIVNEILATSHIEPEILKTIKIVSSSEKGMFN